MPSGGDVCTFKKVIYDRVNDADVKVISTVQIAQMYIRKQEIYTERKVFTDVKSSEDKSDPLNDPINELLGLIKNDPYKIYEEYAHCLKISNSTVKRMLTTLRKQGIIKREGAKKTGHWVVINDPIKLSVGPINDPIKLNFDPINPEQVILGALEKYSFSPYNSISSSSSSSGSIFLKSFIYLLIVKN